MGMTTLETVTLVTAITGAACGILGAVLGIINTWNQVSKNRLRLRVRPFLAVVRQRSNGQYVGIARYSGEPFPPGSMPCLGIQVVNLSSFSVTINEVGFRDPGCKGEKNNINPSDRCGDPLPKRLKPRESMSVYSDPGAKLEPSIARLAKAYAGTSCGQVAYGTSPAFEEYVGELLAGSEREATT
jgi:hypothetical protein